jgi:hypothetical protein
MLTGVGLQFCCARVGRPYPFSPALTFTQFTLSQTKVGVVVQYGKTQISYFLQDFSDKYKCRIWGSI